MEKPTATTRPKAEATSSDSSKTVANNVSAEDVSTITGFFQNVGVSDTNSLPDYCNNKYFYSNIIRHALKPDQVLRGRLTCILTVTPALGNFYGSLHGGSLAAICEVVSIACARTVVAEDKDVFLGDMSISYLSAAPINMPNSGCLGTECDNLNLNGKCSIVVQNWEADVIIDCSVVRGGRNLTVVATEFKVKKTGQLAYTARAIFYNMPIAKI
uniref:Thioesterase domain-containing protein n=1 Tax=Quercus lobata TaxID=97700 RepID=A0A7N2MDL9_QUELO